MQCSQKNFMRIIGNEQKNNGQEDFWEILERIIGKNFGAGLFVPKESLGISLLLLIMLHLFILKLCKFKVLKLG